MDGNAPRNPAGYLVRVPDRSCLVVSFWRVQQGFVLFSSLAWGRRRRLHERLLIIACGCRLLPLACSRCLSFLMACGRCLSLLLMACGRRWHLHGIVRGTCLLVLDMPHRHPPLHTLHPRTLEASRHALARLADFLLISQCRLCRHLTPRQSQRSPEGCVRQSTREGGWYQHRREGCSDIAP